MSNAPTGGEAQAPAHGTGQVPDGAGFWPRRLKVAVIVAGVLMPVSDAQALWKDRLELFVVDSVTHEDNVFRLADGTDPTVALGSSSKSDIYTTTTVGFRLDVPVSRQRFHAGLTWNDHRYDRYTVLDFTSRNGSAIWKWKAGNDLGGELGYSETLELASLANIQGNAQSSLPNPLKTQRTFLNSAYMLTPRWRLQGEVSKREQSNTVFKENDIGISAADFTASYITPAENQVGGYVRVEDGSFPNGQTVGTNVVDNDNRQQNVGVALGWTLTGSSRVSGRAGWINRNYEQISQRDYDGPMYRVAYDWGPTGKFHLTAIAQRDIGADEQVNTSFALVRGFTFYPTLKLTEKLILSGELDFSDRDYLGDAQLVSAGISRSDRVRTTALTTTYKPLWPVTLELRLRRESRSSTLAVGNYYVGIISVSGRISF